MPRIRTVSDVWKRTLKSSYILRTKMLEILKLNGEVNYPLESSGVLRRVVL